MNAMTTTQDAQSAPSRAARYRWPLIIVCMLLGHVAAMMLAVQIAIGDTDSGVNGNRIDPAYGASVEPAAKASVDASTGK